MLISIALPVAFQNLLATSASMVDTIMLASLGSDVVGAVGLCAQFTSLMLGCYWGFVGGGMLFMAQNWGARDDDGVCRSFGATLTCMTTVGVIFGFLAVVLPGTVIRLYTDKSDLWPIGEAYLRIIGWTFPIQVANVAISALLRSTERVKLPLAASIVSLATNMLVNYVLIFGKLGFEAMGVAGAAWGTVASSVVNFAMLLIVGKVTKHPHLLRVRAHFRWSKKFLKQYFVKCFPIICNELLAGVGLMIVNIVLGRQSKDAIAALAVFRSYEGFCISFFSGFTNAASVLVGKEVGAGHHQLAYIRAKRLVFLTPCVVACACAIFLCFNAPFLHAMSLEGEAFRLGQKMLFIFSGFAVIRYTNWILNDSYRSAGDPSIGTILEISFLYLMVIPLVCLTGLKPDVPFIAVFICMLVDEPIRVVIMLRHLISGKWVRPVTDEGLKTIGEFRELHHIKLRGE